MSCWFRSSSLIGILQYIYIYISGIFKFILPLYMVTGQFQPSSVYFDLFLSFFSFFSLCWVISVFVGLFQSLLGYFSLCWVISVFVGLFQFLLGYFSLCWAISVFLGYFSLFLIFVKKQSQELTRVNPDRNIFSINVELTSTFLLYRGLVHHHHEILNQV